MKHIRIFETVADFEAAKDSLAKPNVGLIVATGKPYAISGGSEPEVDYSKVAMFFENVDTQDVTIGVEKLHSNAYTATLETSTDGETWESWGSTGTTALTRTVESGGKLYVRATSNVGYFNNNRFPFCNYFTSTGNVNVGGNIMSLGYKDFEDKIIISQELGYSRVFSNMETLVDASKLVLPATTLVDECYSNMFFGCTGLTTAPALPATTLANSCYDAMFSGCSNLNYIKAMFTTTPGSNTYQWVYGVSSTGTFVKNAAATWDETGINGIPSGWTVETATAE